jgi:hypothetical protein
MAHLKGENMKKVWKKIIAFEKANPLGRDDKGIPLVRAWPREDFPSGCIIVCPYNCKLKIHRHGGCSGHRIAHCGSDVESDNGYTILRRSTELEVNEV